MFTSTRDWNCFGIALAPPHQHPTQNSSTQLEDKLTPNQCESDFLEIFHDFTEFPDGGEIGDETWYNTTVGMVQEWSQLCENTFILRKKEKMLNRYYFLNQVILKFVKN